MTGEKPVPDRTKIQIRPLCLDDAAAVASLEQEIFGTPWSEETVKTTIACAEETAVRQLSGELVHGALHGAFGAFFEGQLAGYLFAMSVAGESELHRIAAAPAFRRQGIGDALMESFLSWSRDYGEGGIWLEVRAGNEAAAALYKKHGFSEAGSRKQYYRNPTEDARIFTLQEIPSVYH